MLREDNSGERVAKANKAEEILSSSVRFVLRGREISQPT